VSVRGVSIFQSHVESPERKVDDCAAAPGQDDAIEKPQGDPKFEKDCVEDMDVSEAP
jgi:hypothetical protein